MKPIAIRAFGLLAALALAACNDTNSPAPPPADASAAFTSTVIIEAGTASNREPDDIGNIVAAGSETSEPADISAVVIGI